MKLWILRPKGYKSNIPTLWGPWYDKAFGFVIQAETEERARELAQHLGGNETRWPAWTDSELSTCRELVVNGPEHIVISDYRIHSDRISN